jgi:hypothetical protein
MFCAGMFVIACDKEPEIVPEVDTGVEDKPDAGPGQPDADEGYPDAPTYPDAEVDGGGPPDNGGNPDAEPPPPPPSVRLSGKVTKLGAYLGGTNEYTGQAAVLAYGVVPQASTLTSDQQATLGEYTLTVPTNGQLLLYTQKLGYNPTYNRVTTEAVDITGKNIYLAENAWLNEIAAAHNVDLTTDFACHAPL